MITVLLTFTLVITTFVLFSSDSALQQALNLLMIPAEMTPPKPFTHARFGEMRDFVLLIAGSIALTIEILVLVIAALVFANSQNNLILDIISILLSIISAGYLLWVSSLYFTRMLTAYLIRKPNWQFLRKISILIEKAEDEPQVIKKSARGFIAIFVGTELMLGLDNVIAALNITKNLYLLGFGVLIAGIIVFRGIKQISVILEKVPTTKHGAQIVLFLLGTATALSLFSVAVPEWVQEAGIIIVLGSCVIIDLVFVKKQDQDAPLYDLVPDDVQNNLINDGSLVLNPGEKKATLTLRLKKGLFPAGVNNTIIAIPQHRSTSLLYITRLFRRIPDMVQFVNTIKDKGLLTQAPSRPVTDTDKEVDVVAYSLGPTGKNTKVVGTYAKGKSVKFDLDHINWGGKVKLLPGVKKSIAVATKPGVDFLYIVILVTGKIDDLDKVLNWTLRRARATFLKKKNCLPVKFLLIGTYKADKKQGKRLDDADVTHTKAYGLDLWDYKYLPDITQIDEFVEIMEKEGLTLSQEIVGIGSVATDIDGVVSAENEMLRETMVYKVSPNISSVTVTDSTGAAYGASIQTV